MKKIRIYLFPLLLVLSWACDNKEMVQNDTDLPRVSTVPNEILVVMDSAQWQGTLGDKLREVYAAPIPALPQEEAAFNVRYISPRYFKGFLKLYPNIVFVTTLDDRSKDSRVMRTYFTDNSLEQIRENEDLFMFARENEFARGQQVLHLFSQTEEALLQKLEQNKEKLYQYFLGFERDRLSQKLFSGLPGRELTNYVQERHGFRLHFPVGYEVAIEKENFIWLRLLDQEIDKSIWIGYQQYDDENVFTKENILKLRGSFAKSYIWGSDSTTYMRTEQDVPVITREINFNGNYAVEMRGLWRLNEMVMGGPFISYTFVDEATNRLYYIEGFVYAPGEDKREPIREVEAILHTFKSTAERAQTATSSGEATSSGAAAPATGK
jgi:hypothetical protein